MAFGKIELKPLPPKEALEYWEDKVRLSPGEFYALSEEARLRAFAVSGIAKGDELETVYNALRTALEKGITFKKFQEMAKDVFERRGWTGKRAWRVKTIFRTNIQTAYSVGRYRRYQEASEERPYWMYDAINDSRTRPTHAALDGKVFPAGHKFWDTWWPPNGFNCFPPHTEILTSAGWRPISEIKIGDLIIGGSGKEKRVSSIHINPFNGCLIRLKVKNLWIEATPNHRICTIDGWKRAETIKKGDIIVQTPEITRIYPLIGNINKPHTHVSDSLMAFPGERETAVVDTFNAEIERGYKNVNPFRPRIRVYNFIMNWIKTKCLKVLNQQSFSLGGRFSGINKLLRIFSDIFDFSLSSLLSYVFSKPGRIGFQFFGNYSGARIDRFCLSFSGMIASLLHLPDQFFHLKPCLSSPFISIDPLSFDSFTAMPRLDSKMLQQSHEGAVIDREPLANLSVTQFFNQIEPSYDDFSGAPLKFFNSLKGFRAWAWSHAILQVIDDVEIVPYNGNVFNLTVDDDESYITRIGIVHNCRCSVISLTKQQVEKQGLKIEKDDPTGNLIEPVDPVSGARLPARPLMPDPDWDHHPGKSVWGGITPREVEPGKLRDIGPRDFSFYRRRSLKNLRKGDFTPYSEDDLLPEGLDEVEYWKSFASFMGIGDEGGVITDTLGEPLVIGPELFKDRHGHWKIKKRGRERYLKLLAQTIKDPYEIWLTPQKDENTGKVVIRRRYIKAFSSSPQDKVSGFIAFDFGKYEWSGVTAFSPNQLSYGDRVRNGILLYAK